MKVNEIGEIGLINRFSKILRSEYLGDDCAVLDLGEDYLVVTIDMLHRITDFPYEMTPYDIGWMSVAVSLSDVASMGAKPTGVVAAVGLPGDTEVEFAEGIISGMSECARSYGTEIIGGDTDQHAELTIVTTALGRVDKDKVKLRSKAKVGDLLCVTGYVGTPAAGYKVIIEERAVPEDDKKLLSKYFFKPMPRVEEGIKLSKYPFVTSMIDMSDGLGKSIYELSTASDVGFLVDADSLPLRPETIRLAKDRKELLEMAICFGGEFELLFTVSPDKIDDISDVAFTIIGKVVEEGLTLDDKGKRSEIVCKGYEHLRKKRNDVH
ncbi:thiamine-phosphate kinase [Methanocella sp. CWC-04]|uniref:Thiamine-monophosphate kinase n=1 Tax=Methanooceanicella nereidis TaxID=2052831 RepID=A0AAP2REU3_9EURY|nr:thiamine-phosphate kinase [Methanocella sp. CWC-04]MCD1295250.1 thiamine-phosphate kinase [Methanocella sp. CWC-04]